MSLLCTYNNSIGLEQVETLKNPFVAPANIHTIESFINRVGYQGVVDKKKEVIRYPRFTKLIIVDLMKKLPNIPKRIEEDYHSIKDDVSLVSVYTTGNVSVQGMLTSDAFLTAEVRETDGFKEYETVFMKVALLMNQPQPVVSTQGTNRNTPRAHRLPTIYVDPPETKKRKQIAGESKPGSHKDNPEFVDDDDDKAEEKHNDNMGSLDIRNEETQTTIPTPLSSLRKILSLDKKTYQELTDIVSILTTTTFKHSQETHNKIDDILHDIVPQIAENVTNDLIEDNLKPCIANTIIEVHDAFRSEVPALVSQEFNAHAPAIIEELFKNYVQSNVVYAHPTTTTSTDTESFATLQYQLYLKMKRRLQDRADDIALWEALRRKFEKSSPFNTSCREDDFHSQHNEHQDDDAPPEGDKRVKISKGSKRSKSARVSLSKYSSKDSTKYVSKQKSQQQEWGAWEEENVVDEDEVIPEDETPELITKF
ncbi:hypothetical protein Tco_1376756 [Tanacetum coccineum]